MKKQTGAESCNIPEFLQNKDTRAMVSLSFDNTIFSIYNIAMIFEWDERKRLSNLKKHGVDFADAHCVFEDIQIVNSENISKDFGEHRFISIGYYEKWGCITVIIHTKKEERMRIVSFRKANKAEKRGGDISWQ